MLFDFQNVFTDDIRDLSRRSVNAFRNLLVGQSVDETELQDRAVHIAVYVFVDDMRYLTICVVLHFFLTRTRPSPPQFGHFL